MFVQTVDRGSRRRDETNFLGHLTSLFKTGQPNKFHTLVAKLVKSGYVKEVVTTNFDTKLQEAPIKEGMHVGKGFEVLYDEEHSKKVAFEAVSIPFIIKIHGSVVSEKSIRTTLDLISKRSLREERKRILEHFFTQNPNILIMGYSASDEFDINPVIIPIDSESNIY